jgi:hypothetical protein
MHFHPPDQDVQRRGDGEQAAGKLPAQADQQSQQEPVYRCDRLRNGIGNKHEQPEYDGYQAPDAGRPAEEFEGAGDGVEGCMEKLLDRGR